MILEMLGHLKSLLLYINLIGVDANDDNGYNDDDDDDNEEQDC